MDVAGSMKAIETRSPHKYSPVLVGRGYRHHAMELGGCFAGHASQSDDKALSVELECLVTEGYMVWGKEAR